MFCATGRLWKRRVVGCLSAAATLTAVDASAHLGHLRLDGERAIDVRLNDPPEISYSIRLRARGLRAMRKEADRDGDGQVTDVEAASLFERKTVALRGSLQVGPAANAMAPIDRVATLTGTSRGLAGSVSPAEQEAAEITWRLRLRRSLDDDDAIWLHDAFTQLPIDYTTLDLLPPPQRRIIALGTPQPSDALPTTTAGPLAWVEPRPLVARTYVIAYRPHRAAMYLSIAVCAGLFAALAAWRLRKRIR